MGTKTLTLLHTEGRRRDPPTPSIWPRTPAAPRRTDVKGGGNEHHSSPTTLLRETQADDGTVRSCTNIWVLCVKCFGRVQRCSSREGSHLQRHAARRRLVTKHAVALVIRVAPQVVGLRRCARRRVKDRSFQLEEVERVEAAASGVRVTRAREVARSPAVAEVDVGCAPTLCTVGGNPES